MKDSIANAARVSGIERYTVAYSVTPVALRCDHCVLPV
jgi:hypothetical protein